jgi:bifunctional UDP-N-acetylglucosamine pyrophosphorylase/glucosamine-1-phosphate N-acetyltransferase
MKTYAVIPAAGRGTRLNQSEPKLLSKISHQQTIWSVLRKKLAGVQHIHVIVSPEGEGMFREAMAEDLRSGFVSLSLQAQPIGMGDAIFQAYPVWAQAQRMIVVWGDQVFVSEDTIQRSLACHAGAEKTMVLPLVHQANPYVEYVFDAGGCLSKVKQSREGEQCAAEGLADVGTFVMSVSGLLSQWQDYLCQVAQGQCTNEINFLPFLPFLSTGGWQVRRLLVADAREARGINTPDDLRFFQQLFLEEMVL